VLAEASATQPVTPTTANQPAPLPPIVLGGHGIAFTPVAIPTQRQLSESPLRILRDTG